MRQIDDCFHHWCDSLFWLGKRAQKNLEERFEGKGQQANKEPLNV